VEGRDGGMNDFNLHKIALAVIRDHSSADPGDLAEALLAAVPAERYKDALRCTLRGYVRGVLHEVRSGEPHHPTTDPTNEQTTPRKRPSGRSWKVDAIRSGWRAYRLHVEQGWKFLPNCTYDDLMTAAAERRDIAKANEHEAERYERLAALVQRHGETVADAPEAEVTAILDGRAA
jgi:hypothetical protein